MVRRIGSATAVFVVLGLGLAFAASPATLGAQEPVVLDTVTVEVGSRASAVAMARTRSVEVVGAEQLRALPVRTVSEALRLAVGVDLQARSPAQADVSIRGASFEQVVVLVDGVRMSDAQTGHFDLDLTVPLAQVERIEVLRGAASALYGADAIGGVINVVTRAPGQGGTAAVEGGSHGTYRLSVTGGLGESPGSAVDEGERSGAGTASRASGIGSPAVVAGVEYAASDGHRPGTDYDVLLSHARAGVRLGSGTLTATAGHARRDFGADAFYAPFASYEETRTTMLALGWSGAVGGGWSLTPRLSFRRHDDDFVLERDDPSFFRNVHRSLRPGGEIVARWTAGSAPVSVALGAEAYREDLESTNLGDRVEDRGALFSEVAWSTDRVGAQLGARFDAHEGFGPSLSPSLSASYRPLDRVRLRAAAGRSFRTPTFTERYYEDPAHLARTQLDPERAWTAEAGVDVSSGRGTLLRVTVFRRWARDLIDWARPDGAPESRWRTRNVASADFTGLEVGGSARVPGDLTLTGGGSLLSFDSDEEGSFFSKAALRPLTRRLTLGLGRALGSRLHLAAHLLHERRTDEDARTLLDLRAAVDLPAGRLYLDATNVTGADYLDLTGSVAPGRAFAVGFRTGR